MSAEGWTVPRGPQAGRLAHFYRSDSPLFARMRSLCGASTFPEPPRLDTEPPAGVPACERCAAGALVTKAEPSSRPQDVMCDKCPTITAAPEAVKVPGRTLTLCARCAAFYRRAAARLEKETRP